MATNQRQENFYRLELLAPVGVAINPNDLIIFGRSNPVVGCAQTGQAASGTQPYYDNSGYITVQIAGVVQLTVKGFTQGSPSAGAAINRGDKVFADGGTFDITTGITTGSSIDADANGTFIGLALDPVVAGATTSIRVLLKNGAI